MKTLKDVQVGETVAVAKLHGEGIKSVEHDDQKTANDNAPLGLTDGSGIDQCL